jgi:hypothetical protein
MEMNVLAISSLLAAVLFSTPTGYSGDLAKSVENKVAKSTQTIFTLRPSVYSGNPGYSSPTSAYDGNFSTASSVYLSAVGGKGGPSRQEDWFGFPAKPTGATGLTLNINFSAVTSGSGEAQIEYSLDGGTSFTRAYLVEGNKSSPQGTGTLALSNTQDTTQIRVRAQASALTLGPLSTTSESVYEIWISGTN